MRDVAGWRKDAVPSGRRPCDDPKICAFKQVWCSLLARRAGRVNDLNRRVPRYGDDAEHRSDTDDRGREDGNGVAVDIASIFRDQRVLHHVPNGAVDGDIGDPGIILEVNDRTINVYMKAFVPTRVPQIPGNEYSRFRDDLILAWSKTY